jgi:hypothetical protein
VIEDKIKKYFLGELAEVETDCFEEEFAQNPELAEQVQIVENELIDAFVKNQLTQKEIKLFKSNYLTTEKRFEKLNFAKLFSAHLAEQTQSRTIIETANQKFGWYKHLFTRLSFAGLIFTVIGSGIIFILLSKVNQKAFVNTEQVYQSNISENKENTNTTSRQESSDNSLVRDNSKLEISNNQTNSVEQLKNKGNNKRAAHFQNTEKNKTQKLKANKQTVPDTVQKEHIDRTTNPLVTQVRNVETSLASKVTNSETSSVSGVVVNAQGSAIASAIVTLKNLDNGFNRSTLTNESGSYDFTLLKPGKYKIEIEARGFKNIVFGEVQAQIDKTAIVNSTLEVGNVSSAVTISTSTDAPINTTNGSIGNTITTQQIIQLPPKARNTQDLLSLQPGVISEGSVGSGRSDQANITLEGVDVNEQKMGHNFFSVLRVTPEELREFRVTTERALDAFENLHNSGLFATSERTLQSKGEQLVEISLKTSKLIFWLDLPKDTAKYQSYYAVIKTAEGNTVFVVSNLKSPKLVLPADIIKNETYRIFLGGVSSGNTTEYIAEYTFRINICKN